MKDESIEIVYVCGRCGQPCRNPNVEDLGLKYFPKEGDVVD